MLFFSLFCRTFYPVWSYVNINGWMVLSALTCVTSQLLPGYFICKYRQMELFAPAVIPQLYQEDSKAEELQMIVGGKARKKCFLPCLVKPNI